jgi:general stress protein YciG
MEAVMTLDGEKPKAKRGFAAISPERRREIAARGGASVPPGKRSFSQNRELAARAGRIGGSSSSSPKEPD